MNTCPFCGSTLSLFKDILVHEIVGNFDEYTSHFYSKFVNIDNDENFCDEEYYANDSIGYELFFSIKNNKYTFNQFSKKPSVKRLNLTISGKSEGYTIVTLHEKLIKMKALM